MRRFFLFTGLLFTFVLALSVPVSPQGLPRTNGATSSQTRLAFLDQLGGGSYAIDAQGAYVYTAIGPRFAILKQDDVGQLHIVGRTRPLDDLLHSVVTSGSYAYVAEYRYIGWNRDVGKLHVIDISRPDSPEVVNTITGILARDMTISGQYLFIAAEDGLHIFDLSHAPNLREVGSTEKAGSAIVVHNSMAYMTDWYGLLYIFDVTDPSRPSMKSRYAWGSEQAWDITLDFPYLTIANGYYGLTTIDVTDPAHPVKIASTLTRAHAMAITQSDDHLFVATGGRLQVFAKRPQGQLEAVDDSLWLPKTTRQMIVQQNRLFAASGGPDWMQGLNFGGLFVFDITTPTHPVRDQRLSIVAHASDAGWNGDTLYVAGDDGLYILDAKNQQTLTQQAFFSTYATTAIDTQRQTTAAYAFLAQSWQGLEVVDVTNSSAPTHLARYAPESALTVTDVIVDGAYAYLGVSRSQTPLVVLDISSPSHPQQIAIFAVDEQSAHVKIAEQQDKLYLVDGEARMYIIDIADPFRPTETGKLTFSDGTSPREIAVQGGYAFIATSARGVRVIDVSHPDAPQSVGVISLPAFVNHVQVKNNLMITSHFIEGTMQGRLYLTDISDPQQPVILSYVDTSGEPYQVAIRQTDVAVPDGVGGISLYQLTSFDHHLFHPSISH